MKIPFKTIALLGLLLAFPTVMLAQTGASLTLRVVQTELFPEITGFVDARNANGVFIDDLDLDDLVAVEDGVPQPLEQLRLVEPGLRLMVVVNPADSFAIRNSQGATRYELVREQILAWGAGLTGEEDRTVGLLTPDGSEQTLAEPGTWMEHFEEFQPNLAPLQAGVQVFAEALQALVVSADTQPGQGSALWLVSAVPSLNGSTEVESLQELALAEGVRVFIWLVDAPSRLESEEAQQMQALALATGGALFSFSGSEAFPDPDDYFDPLGRAYLFQYTSQLKTDGEHSVVLQFSDEGDGAATQPFTLELKIEPPNPILVSPPAQIERAPSPEDDQSLAPFNQPLEIIIEFPDGVERTLIRTTLYVNGERQAENHSAPFTHFVWGLSGYTTSQRVFIQVEAEDEFGMVGSTMEFPVEISVQQPASSIRNFVARNAGLITLSVAVLAGGAVLATLVLSGRISPPPLRTQRSLTRSQKEASESDPLLQSPLEHAELDIIQVGLDPPLSKEAADEPQRTWAFLQPITAEKQAIAENFIPLQLDEVVIGSEAVCEIFIEDPSVQPRHAKLRRLEDGNCELADLSSESGTWLNYAPVSPEGSRIQDGDMIHIGRVPFRFRINR